MPGNSQAVFDIAQITDGPDRTLFEAYPPDMGAFAASPSEGTSLDMDSAPASLSMSELYALVANGQTDEFERAMLGLGSEGAETVADEQDGPSLEQTAEPEARLSPWSLEEPETDDGGVQSYRWDIRGRLGKVAAKIREARESWDASANPERQARIRRLGVGIGTVVMAGLLVGVPIVEQIRGGGKPAETIQRAGLGNALDELVPFSASTDRNTRTNGLPNPGTTIPQTSRTTIEIAPQPPVTIDLPKLVEDAVRDARIAREAEEAAAAKMAAAELAAAEVARVAAAEAAENERVLLRGHEEWLNDPRLDPSLKNLLKGLVLKGHTFEVSSTKRYNGGASFHDTGHAADAVDINGVRLSYGRFSEAVQSFFDDAAELMPEGACQIGVPNIDYVIRTQPKAPGCYVFVDIGTAPHGHLGVPR